MQRAWRLALIISELALLTALIVAPRCANYQDIFVAGNVYFVDADCYARMTRVEMVESKPGLIVQHHAFENFPHGTTPHTTAPFDYLILGLSLLLKPFTLQPLNFAGALISPLLALFGGWFLWWWSRQMKFRYRWVMLILYATSPILVHGTELGRPDHQSLLILLVAVGICAEWSVEKVQIVETPRGLNRVSDTTRAVRAWALASAAAWALSMWVSLYEPLLLFLILAGTTIATNRCVVFARERGLGWLLFASILGIGFAVERRLPSFSLAGSHGDFTQWASTVGELAHISPMNPVWLNWCGFLLFIAPVLMLRSIRRPRGREPRCGGLSIYVLLVGTYFLTVWQARWGYFFVLIFALALPALLASIESAGPVWIAVVLSMFPIFQYWDEQLWPSEAVLARRVEGRIESAQIRDLATGLRSPEVHPFVAPWWLSPSIAYWSGQPGVAGSSHESLEGIDDSARFFLSDDVRKQREILARRQVDWVFAYDSDRLAQNSAAILNQPIARQPLCRVLDRSPGQAPPFLIFSAQNPTCKLYRVER